METFSTIIPQIGKPLSVAGLFGCTLGAFVTIEKMFAPEALADFARYLKSTNFAKTVVQLPEGTRALFQRVFGARHFSWRCVATSMLFSIAAFTVIVGLTVLYDPRRVSVVREIWTDMPVVMNTTLAWMIWSVVPDYFNLFKTRKLLNLLMAHRIKRPSLFIVMVLADFLIGYSIFIITFSPMGLFDLHLIFYVLGKGNVTWQHIVQNFSFSYPLPLSSIFHWMYGPLFWPGMVPSIWLWLFLLATLIVRVSARTAPALRVAMYWFDGDRHPIRFVGIVAAALVSMFYGVYLLIWVFAAAVSGAT
jgi:hypothetical protein